MKKVLLGMIIFIAINIFSADFVYKVYPKIITPNNDGKNDTLVFVYQKAPYYPYVSGKIYDFLGRKVGEFKELLNPPEYDSGIFWDGSGVPSGIYIYQIDISGEKNKVIHGIVIVVK